jgi:hypothetical protein
MKVSSSIVLSSNPIFKLTEVLVFAQKFGSGNLKF